MHPNPRRIAPIVILIAGLAAAGWYFLGGGRAAAADGPITASGTMEALELHISPEIGGRVTAVHAEEGQPVRAGDVLVQLDTALLQAQRDQATEAAAAAQAAHEAAWAALAAAQANYALLRAGPSAEQLAVTQTVVDRAQIAADAAQEAYDALTSLARESAQGKSLKQQLDLAVSTLENAQAQHALAAAGARPEQLDAAEAQMAAAQAQVEAALGQARAAEAAVRVLEVQLGKLSLTAPADGVVMVRAVQPGELASPGAILLVVGQLDPLTLTVYVPEDRYARIQLGQAAVVSVDSYPGETFTGTVAHIADRPEFTPRNVQTAEGRKTTVYAVKLRIDNASGRLKPGMPADVNFGE